MLGGRLATSQLWSHGMPRGSKSSLTDLTGEAILSGAFEWLRPRLVAMVERRVGRKVARRVDREGVAQEAFIRGLPKGSGGLPIKGTYGHFSVPATLFRIPSLASIYPTPISWRDLSKNELTLINPTATEETPFAVELVYLKTKSKIKLAVRNSIKISINKESDASIIYYNIVFAVSIKISNKILCRVTIAKCYFSFADPIAV